MPHAAFYVVQHGISHTISVQIYGFNAARSILCGATIYNAYIHHGFECFNAARSILCGATLHRLRLSWKWCSFNAARSILCGATYMLFALSDLMMFQCRTQHFMWCNWKLVVFPSNRGFQCRTQHFMWCNQHDAA